MLLRFAEGARTANVACGGRTPDPATAIQAVAGSGVHARQVLGIARSIGTRVGSRPRARRATPRRAAGPPTSRCPGGTERTHPQVRRVPTTGRRDRCGCRVCRKRQVVRVDNCYEAVVELRLAPACARECRAAVRSVLRAARNCTLSVTFAPSASTTSWRRSMLTPAYLLASHR